MLERDLNGNGLTGPLGHVYRARGILCVPSARLGAGRRSGGSPLLAGRRDRGLDRQHVERRGAQVIAAQRLLDGIDINEAAAGELNRVVGDEDAVVVVDANPQAHEHARLRYTRQNLTFERGLVETNPR